MRESIRMAEVKDLGIIAQCHRRAFPSSLSSALGVRYVKAMFEWYLSSDDTFLFFIEEDAMCVGYCGGMVKRKWGVGSASSMAQYSFNSAVSAFLLRPWLVFHREIRAKFTFIVRNIISRLKNGKLKRHSENITIDPYVGLVVIGVDPHYQGKGHGSQLLNEFERIVRQRGFKKMALSVRSTNKKAIRSYSQNGWVVSRIKGETTNMEKILM